MTTALLELPLRPLSWNDDEDPNGPCIPRITGIPGPRTEPEPVPARIPQQPTGSVAPTCCGRPMKRDGSQWVCRRCRAWVTAVASLLPSAARKCTACKGAGGRKVDTSSGGVTRKTWVTCKTCRGTGER